MIIHDRTHSNNYIRFLRHHSPPFLLRDAMLVQYLLSSCVCPSQARIVSKRLDESSWVVICRPPFTYSTLLCKEIGYLQKNMGTSLWDFVANFGLRKFLHGKSIALSTKIVHGRAC